MIFLDLDGTLLDHDASERLAAAAFFDAYEARLSGWTSGQFVDRWQAVAQTHLNRYLAGEITFVEQRRERLRELFGGAMGDVELDGMFSVYLAHYESSWRLFPDVLDALRAFEGRPLGIISNGDALQQQNKLSAVGLADRFFPVVISGRVGAAKPSAAIFLEACRQARCAPHECVYVGDRLETDALASSRAGFYGIWLDRGGGPARCDDIPTIAGLDELPSLVQKISQSLFDKTERLAERS